MQSLNTTNNAVNFQLFEEMIAVYIQYSTDDPH